MHAHVLPGVDDGPATEAEAWAMLAAAAALGITHIVATAHYNEAFHAPDETVAAQVRGVQRLLAERGVALTIIAGREVSFTDRHIEAITRLTALRVGSGAQYVLIELVESLNQAAVKEGVFKLLICGVTPIIAHPERNLLVGGSPAFLSELRQRGALAQMNAGSVAGTYGKQVQRVAHRLLKERQVDVLSSDAHTPAHYRNYQTACETVTREYGAEYLLDMISRVPARLLNCLP